MKVDVSRSDNMFSTKMDFDIRDLKIDFASLRNGRTETTILGYSSKIPKFLRRYDEKMFSLIVQPFHTMFIFDDVKIDTYYYYVIKKCKRCRDTEDYHFHYVDTKDSDKNSICPLDKNYNKSDIWTIDKSFFIDVFVNGVMFFYWNNKGDITFSL